VSMHNQTRFRLEVIGRAMAAHFFSRAMLWSLLLAPLVLWAAAAHSAASVQSERLTYNVMFGGLHIGDALVKLDQTESGYRTELKMTARGVAKWLQNFQSDLRGEGQLIRETGASGRTQIVPQPAAYMRQWSAGDIAADMTMTFDPSTRVVSTTERVFNPTTGGPLNDEDIPWRSRRGKQAPVPADMRKNVFDPIAAFIAVRAQISAQGLASDGPKSFRVPVYDGSRRYDITGKTAAIRTISINGVERRLLPVTAKLEPVFGFSRDAAERMKESEGKLLFTPDERFIPVQVTVGGDTFSGVMNLTADCRENPEPCSTFGQAAE
jgi:hypothetical protein